jgi:chromosome segregation ATPase
MRERMDLAIEERDRAEDEASSIGRRKARELEDLKSRLRDAELDAGRASEARAEAEKREQEFKTKQAQLEQRSAQAQEEVSEVRAAMAQLRDALDEGEKQSREVEREKQELRQTIAEREARLEKLQKSSKAMAEEMRALQTASSRVRQTSARSSVDSSRVTSPTPSSLNGASGKGTGDVDFVYLKNVLLQFLETPEKKHQMQLVPVLGVLLQMDK